MVGVDIDTKALIARMTDLEKRVLPQITERALNDSAFEVRQEWADTMPKVFDRPTQLTLRAPLIRKATANHLTAEVYIRNEALKGRSPAEYLREHVFPGPRPQRRGEALLQRATRRKFYVPSRSLPLDQYGNPKRGTIGRVLSQLQASRDTAQDETRDKRARRLKRQRRKGGGGSFFVLTTPHGKLRPGVVYERIESAFGSGVRGVFTGIDSAPRYPKSYDVFGLAQSIFARRFNALFSARLAIATRGRL